MLQKIIILGTGGTIAGWAPDPKQGHRYESARLGIGELTRAGPCNARA
jgi:L-asparaginase/Glu-tRNA(Gln) amidotransferase subunit D